MITENSKLSMEYAVLIPVVKDKDGDALLMEVRSRYVRQPGEVCFPGGKIEKGETPVQAALRETCEELGLCGNDFKLIGVPKPEQMTDGRVVHPVIASICVDCLERISLAKAEVESVFLLPVKWLAQNEPEYFDLSKKKDEELPAELKGYLAHYGEYRRRGQTHYWEYEGHGIWGLTARIIMKLIDKEGIRL